MIPDEAIEAAHRAWREQNTEPGTIFEYNLRAAMEAAAPILQAAAWEEGEDAGYEQGREWPDMRAIKNPYRPTT